MRAVFATALQAGSCVFDRGNIALPVAPNEKQRAVVGFGSPARAAG
jgi:hypothetical protein